MPDQGYYNVSRDITPSDTVNFQAYQLPDRKLCDAIYVGGAGVVVVVLEDGSTSNFTAVAGEILPIGAKRVNSTSTTATLLRALYAV